MKRQSFLKKLLLVLGLTIVFGALALTAASSVLVRRTVLLTWPRPVPQELASVKPAPGAHIAASAFNQMATGKLGYGLVSVQTYIDVPDPEDSLLLINGTDTSHYWQEERNWIGIGYAKSWWDQEGLTTMSWNMYLEPGDYLAELMIKGITTTLVYEWAFGITDG